MNHVETLKNHPHRDLLLAAAGVTALLGLYACYRCCCARKKKVEEPKPREFKRYGSPSSLYLVPATPAPPEEKIESSPRETVQIEAKKSKEVVESKDVKPYLSGIRGDCLPLGLVCPPARRGVSLFMDTRPMLMHPAVTSHARTYQRDRWYRGSCYPLTTPSPAFTRASQYPLTKRCARPGKMLKLIDRKLQ